MKTIASGSINVKRFYLIGVQLREKCPTCGEMVEWDGDDQYVSYPVLGKVEKIYMYCDGCGNDFPKSIRLSLTVETFDKESKAEDE